MAQALYSCKVSGGVKEELKDPPPAPPIKGGEYIVINPKEWFER